MRRITNDFWLKLIVYAFILVSMYVTGGSILNIFQKLSGDALRAFVVTASFCVALALWTKYAFDGLDQKHQSVVVFAGITWTVFILLGFTFLILNSATISDTFTTIDSRIQLVMTNVVWIPSTLIGALTFGMMIFIQEKAKGFKTDIPLAILEALVVGLAIIGSLWGTADAYYSLTSDVLGAGSLAITTDLAIVAFILWEIRANDKYTREAAKYLAFVYFALSMLFQLVDGAIRLQNLSSDSFLRGVASYLPPVVPFLTGFAFVVLLFVDRMYGGLSFGPQSRPQVQARPSIQLQLPLEPPNGSKEPERPPLDRPHV